MTDAASVGLELRFPRSARPNPSPEPGERGIGANEPGEQVLQLGQLHLKLALASACAPREDVEDQLRAVDDLSLERLFQVPRLRGAQLVVEDDGVDPCFIAGGRQHPELSAAEKRSGVRLRAVLKHAQRDLRAGRVGEIRKFVERVIGVE